MGVIIMPIQLVCSGCNAKITAKDKLAGKRVKCPKCQTVLDIPVAEVEDLSPTPQETSKPIPPATDRQKEYALSLGIEFAPDINRREISELINEAVEKRDEERFRKLEELSDRESEAWNEIRREVLAQIDEEDCRLSKATPMQIVEELGTRGQGAVLITFELDEVEDFENLTGMHFVVSFSDDTMTEDEVMMVLGTLGYSAFEKQTGRSGE